MFRLEHDELHVLDGTRNVLMSSFEKIEDEIIFKYYSKSKVEELIKLGGKRITIFENRKNVFSVSNGPIILEKSWNCPPFCIYDNTNKLSLHIK